jgi:hypothetical protein
MVDPPAMGRKNNSLELEDNILQMTSDVMGKRDRTCYVGQGGSSDVCLCSGLGTDSLGELEELRSTMAEAVQATLDDVEQLNVDED